MHIRANSICGIPKWTKSHLTNDYDMRIVVQWSYNMYGMLYGTSRTMPACPIDGMAHIHYRITFINETYDLGTIYPDFILL